MKNLRCTIGFILALIVALLFALPASAGGSAPPTEKDLGQYERIDANADAIAGLGDRIDGWPHGENAARLAEGACALGMAAASHAYDPGHAGLQASLGGSWCGSETAYSLGIGAPLGQRWFVSVQGGRTSAKQSGGSVGATFFF